MSLHHLLRRQFKKIGVDFGSTPGSLEQWQRFIHRVNRTYIETDQTRYLLERSQSISSNEMREQFRRLEETQQFLGVGNWSIDLPDGSVQCSKECLRILDLPLAPARPNYHELTSRIPADDRRKLERQLRCAVHDGTTFEMQLRIITTSGRLRWVHAIGRPVRGSDGTVCGLHGAVTDITSQILTEHMHSTERKITHLLITAQPQDDVVRKVIKTICEAHGWACGALWKLDKQTAILQRSAVWTVQKPSVADFFDHGANAIVLPAWFKLVGRTPQSGESVWISDLTTDPDFPRAAAARMAGLCSMFAFPVETDGGIFCIMELFAQKMRLPDQEMRRSAHFIGRHLAQFFLREQQEVALRESESHFRALVEQASDSFYMHDAQGYIIDVNQRGCDSLGYAREDLLGMSIADINADVSMEKFKCLLEQMPTGAPISLETRHKRKDGSLFPVEISIGPVDVGGRRHFLSLARNVAERKKLQDQLHHQAYHDLLTNLPNRAKLNARLCQAIEHARQHHRALAVLLIDLDRFKNINDTLGHDAGDKLLQEMALRISLSIRPSDTLAHHGAANGMVARLGGDEFIVLVEDIAKPADVGQIARRILANIGKAFALENQLIRMTASIGISLYPQDGSNDYMLMKHADVAMYRAKEHGKNAFAFYSTQMDEHSASQLALESGLHMALERDELVLHYQPIVDAATGRIVGAEALVRWLHPEHGLMQPDEFIPLAEEIGLIVPLSKWVLENACTQHVAWRRQGIPALDLAVNLSPRHFMDKNIEHELTGILRKTGMDPHQLELEVTESMMVHNVDLANQVLAAFRRAGVRIAIDDFGVGYSSLSQVKHFPIDIIKIDKSFVADIPGPDADEAIINAIIAMGKSLKITLVAEGVESKQQLQFLRSRGCDQIQGYLFSKPLPADAFASLVRENVALVQQGATTTITCA